MLVLSRKLSQQILIGSNISITVVKIEGNQVRLGIAAPHGVSIVREERIGRQNQSQGTATDEVRRQDVLAR